MKQRICNKCGELKPLTEFYKTGRKTDKQADKRHYSCKVCTKQRLSQTPRNYRAHHLRRAYGISIEEYDTMLAKQDHRCAVCGTDDPGGKHKIFNVDHCHSTGKVRALLCRNCNMLLGMAKDRPEYLTQLIAYLVKHS